MTYVNIVRVDRALETVERLEEEVRELKDRNKKGNQ